MIQPSASPARPGVRPPRFHYAGYAAVAGLKQLCGLGLARNRKFLVWKLMRLLETGRIAPDRLAITAAGKTDGVGAQALARFSARCLAAGYGLRYVHTPFQVLAHAEMPAEQWLRSWEDRLALGHAATRIESFDLEPVALADYLARPDLWDQDTLVTSRHYHAFHELAPETGAAVARALRTALAEPVPTARHPGELHLCLHVRRGDVRPGDPETGHRFTANGSILPLLEAVLRAASKTGHRVRAQLHSNGQADEFREFERVPGLEFHFGKPALETFDALAAADLLITTRSDFSYLAGLYCRGLVLCDPRHRPPLPDWRPLDPSGPIPDLDWLAAEIRHALSARPAIPSL